MTELSELDAVLGRFGFEVGRGTPLDRVGGGFSGADVWRVETAAGPCCLRRWPADGPDADRIRWIHVILRHAHAVGCKFLPLPLEAADSGSTLIHHGERLWELSDWATGHADYAPEPSEAKLRSTIRAFATFHAATVNEPWASAVEESSPGIAERLARLDAGLASGLRDLRAADAPFDWRELAGRRDEYVALFAKGARIVRPQLVAALQHRRRLQPCVRDVRREHLLFVEDQLSGLVDFGAMQMEHPAIDVARIVAECAGDDEPLRDAALAEYRSAAPSELAIAADPALVQAFDGGNLLLSPGNWLRWILVENREFPDRSAVLQRFDALMVRLRRLVDRG